MSSVNINPHRPYYTPGLHQHNYTSLSSNDSVPLVLLDSDKETSEQLKGLTGRCLSFASLKYFVTMLTSPFEVGTTLLQVQYSPHEDVEVLGVFDTNTNTNITTSLTSSIHHEDTDEEEEEEEEDFFKRPERQSLDTIRMRRTDSQMFISVYDEKNRATHQMAPMEGGGVLEIMTMIIKQPTEGWKALFKGQRVTWIYEMVRTILRPGLENTVNDLFGLYDDTIPLLHLDNVTPNISTIVFSHLVIGLLLSPLEIIKTRLIVQSSSSLFKKYNGPFHALTTLFKEEGGLYGVYFKSVNLFPTLLYHLISPLLSCSTPLIISRLLHISASDNPILYGAAELAISTLGLVIMMPIETIRRRLQCQTKDQHSFKSAVALRPIVYRGFFDALYKIMKEEGTKSKRSAVIKKQQNSSSSESDSDSDLFPAQRKTKKIASAWGMRGLYRGFTMQLMMNIMYFTLHTMNGIDELDGFTIGTTIF